MLEGQSQNERLTVTSAATTSNDSSSQLSPIKRQQQTAAQLHVLDESDATSMTTISTSGTPSPYNNSTEKENSGALSMTMASTSSAAYSMLSALTATPRRGSDGECHNSTSASSSNHTSPTTLTPPSPSRLTSSHHIRSSSGSSEDVIEEQDLWSDSDDDINYEDDEEHKMTMNSKLPRHQRSQQYPTETPPRRTTWNIQQALFPEEEPESRTPPPAPSAISRRLSSDDGSLHSRRTTTTRRAFHRSASDSPAERNALETASSTVPETQAPIRTRRFRRATVANFLMPEHRRNSTGEGWSISQKIRASPKPHGHHELLTSSPHRHSASSVNHHPDDHNNHHDGLLPVIPNSHSKSKKLKQQRKNNKMGRLDLPGISSLEERLSQVASNHSLEQSQHEGTRSSSSASTTATSASKMCGRSMWRMLLCKIRVTTLIWGLVLIGVATLGRTAMLTTSSFGATAGAGTTQTLLEAPVPTGGLRGSLLLATVGRHKSNSSDGHATNAATVKKTKTSKTKKDTPKKKKDQPKTDTTKTKHTAKEDKHKTPPPVKKDKGEKTGSHAVVAASSRKSVHGKKSISVARPRPLDPSVALPQEQLPTYKDHDPSMFSAANVVSANKDKNSIHRVVMLHPEATSQPSGKVQQYPAEFTDNTQFYSQFESSDERLRKMELREPYEQGECVPMQEWQTTFHPSCNGVHELGVENLGEESTETDVQLFGTKGYWRYAWRLDLRKQGHRKQTEEFGDRVVLKTLKFRHDFEDAHFEHNRIDAVAMERLTSSPHVINIFGFCGHSVLTEYANGPRLGELADKSRSKPLERLKIARDIANGLADVHGIDSEDGKNATFVHLDINPANVVSIGGTLKLNDFNIGIIRRWNTTSQEPCGFPAQYPNPQWRSPEEARNEKNLTEKVDVFSMGHIFFRLICGHEPWNKLESGGKPSKDVINAKVEQGKLPSIPEAVMKTDDPEVAAMRDAMLDCYKADPKDRPSSREIAKKLEAVLEKLSAEE